MAQIKVEDLSFYYDGSHEHIFEHVSFQIDTNWKLGFIGRNGRGKTTFLKLLQHSFQTNGNRQPSDMQYSYTGTILADMPFTYFPYEVKEQQKDTIDVLADLEPDYELWRVLRELSLLSVDAEVLYRHFSLLSGGEKTKVLLALLFSKEEHFLLIDEPTNHLDMEGRRKVAEYLNRKRGFVLVSHDRQFLDTCVDHVLVLEKQNITVMKGNFTSWWKQKSRRDAFELSQNKKLLQDIARLKTAAKQTEQWSEAVEKTKLGTKTGGLKPDRGYIGHKAAKMMKRSKTVQNRVEAAVEEKSRLLKNIETAEELKLFPLFDSGSSLVTANHLSLFYGNNSVCRDISFTVDKHRQVALTGRNGCGKSTILKRLLGEEIKEQGELRTTSGLILSYVPQDVSGLSGSLSAYAQNMGISRTLFFALLRKLDLPRQQFEQDISCYSQGQKKKVALAGSLSMSAHLYLWDEPLNYVDIFSRMQLAQLIKNYRPTMLLVEHDRSFLEEIGAEEVAFKV